MMLQCKQIGREWGVKRLVFMPEPAVERPRDSAEKVTLGNETVDSYLKRELDRVEAAFSKYPEGLKGQFEEEKKQCVDELKRMSVALRGEWKKEREGVYREAGDSLTSVLMGITETNGKVDYKQLAELHYDVLLNAGKKIFMAYIVDFNPVDGSISLDTRKTVKTDLDKDKDLSAIRLAFSGGMDKIPQEYFVSVDGLTKLQAKFLEKYKAGADFSAEKPLAEDPPASLDSKKSEMIGEKTRQFEVSVRQSLVDKIGSQLPQTIDKANPGTAFRKVSFVPNVSEISVTDAGVAIPESYKEFLNVTNPASTPPNSFDMTGKSIAMVGTTLILVNSVDGLSMTDSKNAMLFTKEKGWSSVETFTTYFNGLSAAIVAEEGRRQEQIRIDAANELEKVKGHENTVSSTLVRGIDIPFGVVLGPSGSFEGVMQEARSKILNGSNDVGLIRQADITLASLKSLLKEKVDAFRVEGASVSSIKSFKLFSTGNEVLLNAYTTDPASGNPISMSDVIQPSLGEKASDFLASIKTKFCDQLEAVRLGDMAKSISDFAQKIVGAISNVGFVRNFLDKNKSARDMLNKAGAWASGDKNFDVRSLYGGEATGEGQAGAPEALPELVYDKDGMEFKLKAQSKSNRMMPSGRVSRYDGAEIQPDEGKKFTVVLEKGGRVVLPDGFSGLSVSVDNVQVSTPIPRTVEAKDGKTVVITLDKVPRGIKFYATGAEAEVTLGES